MRWGCALGAYTTILLKMSTLALVPEIAYLGFLSIRNSVLTIKILSDQISRVYKSISEKVSIFSPDPVIANLGVIQYQKLNNM